MKLTVIYEADNGHTTTFESTDGQIGLSSNLDVQYQPEGSSVSVPIDQTVYVTLYHCVGVTTLAEKAPR